MSKDYAGEHGAFPLTNWSLVGHAATTHEGRKTRALEELVSLYRPALKTHLIARKQIDPNQAEDLLQGFLVSKFVSGQFLPGADQRKGKFRTYVLTALENYMKSAFRQEGAKKRRPEGGFVSIDDLQVTPADDQQISDAFDSAWARKVIEEVLARMKQECLASGREAYWGAFEARVAAPILDGDEPPSIGVLIERYGFKSPMQASNAIVTTKRMFTRILYDVVEEYAGSKQNVEAEIRELRAILSRAGAG